ncbi:peptidase S41 [Paenibacillus selenitireducens]|uniref:Peptidase S41 n=1 Tax=Paenibacillus selenitireducens TaxID=1324314 RepID=A0A1T2X8A5_9BACL|nr:S41 family peptidase [Paenibacillus selenitireducens]OPA76107.1 peptidase S41 [Paenibacillus selenitireducens]
MKFTGRSVLAFMLLTMFATCLITLTVVNAPIAVNGRQDVSSTKSSSKGFTNGEFKKLNATLQIIEDQFYSEVDREKVIDGAVNGMMDALKDPYSVYMNSDSANQLMSSLEGTYSGIGAEVTLEDNQVMVLAPIKDTPADRAGIHPKDVFVSINGEKLEGLKLNEAVDKIRGPKGTKAKIKVKRAGASELLDFEVVRADINVETVYGQMLDNRIGKIEVRQFSMNTGTRFNEELKKLEQGGMKGLIIDVRNNPGGFVPVAEAIADNFVPAGKAIYQQERRGEKKIPKLSKGKNIKKYPIVVLMNEGSASASEILAGALKDHHLANLVGVTTFGKGTMQMTYPEQLGDGSMLKMTIAKWLTPNGTWIHKLGIKPDIEAKEPDYYFASRLSQKEELKYDMNSDDVKNAQIMLNGLEYKTGRKDGYFDRETENAVKAFQHHENLAETGRVDTATAAKLEGAIKKRLLNPAFDTQLNKAIEVLRQEIR